MQLLFFAQVGLTLCCVCLCSGWSDIGYNFLVGEDGNIYEGRGWGKVGAHARGHNSDSIGELGAPDDAQVYI